MSAANPVDVTLASDNNILDTHPLNSVRKTANSVLQTLIGLSWPVGADRTIRFSFISAASSENTSYISPNGETNLTEVEEAVKNNVRDIFRKYSEIIDINFVEVPDSADSQVRIVYSDGPQGPGDAYAYMPGDPGGGTVHLNPDDAANPFLSLANGAGSPGYYTLMHEIGHTLGLTHPGNYNSSEPPSDLGSENFLDPAHDNVAYAVMSYNGAHQQNQGLRDPSTPMSLDIEALQTMYGANTATRASDTTYHLLPQDLVQLQTIWDGGGNDTIDASALPISNYFFDLASEGRMTQQDFLANRVFTGTNEHDQQSYNVLGAGWVVGVGANLENLIGTLGNDVISGNDFPNVLMGLAGNDSIDGEAENDTLFGNQGDDELLGNQGDDDLYGGKGSDWLIGGMGSDFIFGNLGNDTLYGDDFNNEEVGDDLIYGGQGNDVLYGGPGYDTLSGDLGDDILTGGDGNNTFVISPNSGFDIITDFYPGLDQVALAGLQFSDLTPELVNGNTTWYFGETPLVGFMGVTPDMFAPSDFIPLS